MFLIRDCVLAILFEFIFILNLLITRGMRKTEELPKDKKNSIF